MDSVEVAVVGGGIAGLAAAYELKTRGVSFRLFEGASRAGGVILTECVDGFTIDAGPDSLLVQKPAAVALCRELGLGDRLIPIRPPRTAFILRRGTLHPLPEASVLGVPASLRPLVASSLFSVSGRLRMALDLVLPRKVASETADESIASFFRRRFGAEAVDYLAEPLLAGIHSGNVERLSMRALFPRLLEAERQHGSVIRAVRTLRPTNAAAGLFRSFPGGIAELVTSLIRALPEGTLCCGARVSSLDGPGPYTVRRATGEAVRAGAVILAIPAYAAGDLVAPLDAELAGLCRSVPYTSTAVVVLAYPRAAVRHPLLGTGFLVPCVERDATITAASWISSKWPNRAPAGHVLLRAFLGGTRDPDATEREDRTLVEQAHSDLATTLHIDGSPSLTKVYRWDRGNPQHEVGHLARVAAIDQALRRWPGLYLTGSGFRGTGIPDCIADARSIAAAVAKAQANAQPTRSVQ